ncbi:MAG: 3'(2'),5'-bisphosphate nucleotidase [Phycisphaerales bacterium]
MSDTARRLPAALAAVADACRVTRAVQANMQRVARIVKDDRSPVTVADFASQAVVARRLREALGTPPLLVAEETSAFLRNPENTAHLDATLAAAQEAWPEADVPTLLDAIDDGASDTHHAGFWTLDPIDGTKGFLRGQQYAVSLAYVERGEVVLGVLGCPNLPLDFSQPLDRPDRHGSVYYAVRGAGAFELTGDKLRESPRRVTRLDHAPDEPVSVCMSVEDAHTSADGVAAVLARLSAMGVPTREPARLDSQAKYAVVARGQADAYLRLPTKKGYVELIWDHAAGALIAHEAGCAVTDIDGRALDFSRGRRLEKNRGIVAAPPALHGKLLSAIKATA